MERPATRLAHTTKTCLQACLSPSHPKASTLPEYQIPPPHLPDTFSKLKPFHHCMFHTQHHRSPLKPSRPKTPHTSLAVISRVIDTPRGFAETLPRIEDRCCNSNHSDISSTLSVHPSMNVCLYHLIRTYTSSRCFSFFLSIFQL